MNILGRLLRNTLTGNDNETYEMAQMLTFLGVLVFLGLAIANYTKFDPQTFGIGLGSALAGMGAAMALKPKDPAMAQDIRVQAGGSTVTVKEN